MNDTAKTERGLEATRALMGALVRMKPKPHEEMKLGSSGKAKRAKGRKKAKRIKT